MARTATVFHGSSAESDDLIAALSHNCDCQKETPSGIVRIVCAAHRAAFEDQRFVDGVVFVRRELAVRLIREEHRT